MRKWLWLLPLLACACAPAREVEVLQPRHGDLVEAFSEEARTRIARTYPVCMPAAGRIGRILLEPGDRVRQGQVLTSFDRLSAENEVRQARARIQALELRQRAALDLGVEEASAQQARFRLEAQRQSLATLRSELSAARTQAQQAEREAQRYHTLYLRGYVTLQDDERSRMTATTSEESVLQAQARLARADRELVEAGQAIRVQEEQAVRRHLESQSLTAELAAARAQLESALHERSVRAIRAPIDGVVLERYEQGSSELAGGTRLLLLGDPRCLEGLSEVLTEDALKVAPGTPVELESSPEQPLVTGKVARIEPAGFTKLSSLGVEQQRVKVIIRLQSYPATLGTGYRLRARFVTRRGHDLLLVPRYSVLQRPDGSYAVLAVVQGRLHWQPVQLGLRGESDLEIRQGAKESDRLVALPEATMNEGEQVTTVPYSPH